eukprot:UC1_evm1s792
MEPDILDTLRKELLRPLQQQGGARGREGRTTDGDTSKPEPKREQGEGLHTGGGWYELDLIRNGHVTKGSQAQFPQTHALLAPLRAINARVSTLQPGTHIYPHCGVTNAKLRAHIPLRVPPC